MYKIFPDLRDISRTSVYLNRFSKSLLSCYPLAVRSNQFFHPLNQDEHPESNPESESGVVDFGWSRSRIFETSGVGVGFLRRLESESESDFLDARSRSRIIFIRLRNPGGNDTQLRNVQIIKLCS